MEYMDCHCGHMVSEKRSVRLPDTNENAKMSPVILFLPNPTMRTLFDCPVCIPKLSVADLKERCMYTTLYLLHRRMYDDILYFVENMRDFIDLKMLLESAEAQAASQLTVRVSLKVFQEDLNRLVMGFDIKG